MKKLSAKQKKAYLKAPSSCPHCGSTSITADHIEADGKIAWSNVECQKCGEVWKDTYTLTSIEEYPIAYK
jgi:predicted Zn finger-like uncharacterized protein